MDFNKLKEQASSFMNQQNHSSNQGSADPNINTNTGGMSNTGDISNTGSTGNMGDNMGDNTASANNSNEDYGDKGSSPFHHFPSTTLTSTGLDFLEKKTGHTFSRDQNEKITDGARDMFEEMTGKKIDPRYSN
jgi:hypothetical protein